MAISAPAKFCTSCGEPLEPGDRFCTDCGAPVAAADVVRDRGDAPTPAETGTETGVVTGSGENDFTDSGVQPPVPAAAAPTPTVADNSTEPRAEAAEESPATAGVDDIERRADVVAASFQFFVVREVDPTLDPEVEGLIYPLPAADMRNSVVLEPRDGDDIKRIVASGFKVVDLTGGKAHRLSSTTDLRLDVIITDARVALACSKFAKGGGWTPLGVGALPVTLVLNGVSKARAASRRRGKMLVGQIRYPWVAAVGGSTKSGFGTNEQLRLCVGTLNRRLLALDLTLPKNIDSTSVAAEIARRIARFRIESSDSRANEHLTELDELTKAAPLPSAKGQFGLRAIPGHWEVAGKSARLGLRRA